MTVTEETQIKNAATELVQLCRLFTALERDAICCGDVTIAQCTTLQELLPGARDVSSLATSARVSKSAMTRLLDGLVKREFVVRGRDDDDRRRVIVALTPTGREEALRLRKGTEDVVRAVLTRLPEDKRAAAMESLTLIGSAVGSLLNNGVTCC